MSLARALSSVFSPTLCWMVLQSYGQPRLIKGLESYSHQVQTKQGILFGCPLATTLLRVPYFRTLARLAQQHSSVSFGVLVDDWSVRWRTSIPHGRGLRLVVGALGDTLKSLTMLGSFPSSSKSGVVCSNARVERRLRPFLRPFEMKVKRQMRDLGHEQSGPYARRLVERERMAAGIKASVPLSAGLTPSWSHGAATRGLLPSALKTQRTAAAQLLGLNKLQSRSMAFALAPNAKYDPLFAATIPLVQEYAT